MALQSSYMNWSVITITYFGHHRSFRGKCTNYKDGYTQCVEYIKNVRSTLMVGDELQLFFYMFIGDAMPLFVAIPYPNSSIGANTSTETVNNETLTTSTVTIDNEEDVRVAEMLSNIILNMTNEDKTKFKEEMDRLEDDDDTTTET